MDELINFILTLFLLIGLPSAVGTATESLSQLKNEALSQIFSQNLSPSLIKNP